MKYETGKLIEGLSFDEYNAEPGLRSSALKEIKRSPAHYQASLLQDKKSDAMEFGKMFHLAMENPEKLRDLLVVEPIFSGKTKDGRDSTRSGEAKEAKAQWYKDLPKDAVVVTKEDADRLHGMIQSMLKHRLVGNLIKTGVRETSLWVEDPETGVMLKCRPDFISQRGFIVDLKTTRDAREDFFLGQIFSSRGSSAFYILQAAHYVHCAKLAGIGKDSLTIVAIESEAPFGIKIYPLDTGCLDVGERERARLTKIYADCLKRNEWTCYDEKPVQVTIPNWVGYDEYGEF